MANRNYITAIGGFKRLMAVRLKPGADMLLEIENACIENGIQNGVVVSGIGGGYMLWNGKSGYTAGGRPLPRSGFGSNSQALCAKHTLPDCLTV